MRLLRILLVVVLAGFAVAPALAVNPDEVLSDPALEARARTLSKELRCLVCQNESIDDSDADLAHDLRVLVRDRLKAGDSDQQVLDYIVARYGEFVLLRPVVAWHTIVLWVAAPLVLVGGLVGLAIVARRRRSSGSGPIDLSQEEQQALARLGETDQ